MVESETEAMAEVGVLLDLARLGDFSRGSETIDQLAKAFCKNLHILHMVGTIKQMRGQYEEAIVYYLHVLEIEPNFFYTEMELGSTYRAMDRLKDALAWYKKAIQSNPTYALAYQCAASTCRELADHQGAAKYLATALALDPTNLHIAGEIAIGLIHLTGREDAIEALAPIVAAPGAPDEHIVAFMRLLNEIGASRRLIDFVAGLRPDASEFLLFHAGLGAGHARLSLSYNHEAIIAGAITREASAGWRDTAGVLTELRGAIASRTPYSLIRLGDGEARFLAFMDPTTRRVLPETDAMIMLDSIWQNWFGQPHASFSSFDLTFLNSAVIRSIATASIIGVPMATRLSEDRQHFGYLAYLGGLVEHMLRDSDQLCTDASIPIDLHRASPFLGDLLTGADFVGVIGPHADLPARIAARFGIARTAFYPVPGERRLPPHLISQSDRHFPDRYREILRDLAVPERGAIFLVAAGLLGKVYCARIHELGGIAIDIGSLADGWMGFGPDTRPGQFKGDQAGWVLPEIK
jgi:Flp pilus assembly protein TadD